MQTEKNIFAYLALVVVCVVWGTTYFALRVGVETFPPFLFSAIRQVLAGGILLIVLQKGNMISRYNLNLKMNFSFEKVMGFSSFMMKKLKAHQNIY